MGIVGGGEASAASQTATGGRSTRHERRWFGRLEQEDQRLKKHYGRWMDIIRSLELESCILTKLTKPSVPVNLVGPQVSVPQYWVPASRGSIHFFVPNSRASTSTSMYVHVRDQNDNATYASTRWVPTVRHFLACEDVAGGSQQSGGRIVCFCSDALPCVRRCSW